MRSRVLVVDDDSLNTDWLTSLLVSREYDVRAAGNADMAMSAIREWQPAAILTDLELPLVNGIQLCRRVRQQSNVPIIVLSSDSDARFEVAALDAGADDYIGKPFTTERLLARLRVAVRRQVDAPEPSSLGVGEFLIDFHDRRVHVHGRPVRLTPKEFDLFVFMARNPNRVLPHKTLLSAVWGRTFEDQSEYLRVFVGQLRKKLETHPSNPRYLVTEPWVGYRLNPTGTVQ
jgi:two-component system KDP operon response regulator KdpE